MAKLPTLDDYGTQTPAEETTKKPQTIMPRPMNIDQFIEQNLIENDPYYTLPVEYYNPYAEDVPTNVTEAQQQYADINIASQDYADEMTARIIRDHNGYMADPNYQGMLNQTYTNQVYDYIKRANNGADDSAWKTPNPQDNLYSVWLPNWIAAQELERQAQADIDKPTEVDPVISSVYDQTTTSAQRAIMNANQIEHGNWNLLSWQDKAKYLLMPGSSATTMDDSPSWAKFIQNIFPSIMAGGAGAMVGSLIPIPGAGLVTGLVVGGLSYLQGVTGIEIPVINKLLEGLDILSVWTEQAQGAVGAAITQARKQLKGQEFDLLDLIGTTVDVLHDNPLLWEVGKYSYEASADLGLDDLALFIRNTGAKVSDELLGTNFGQRDISQVSRANIGRGGLEYVEEGTQGYSSLIETYLPVFEGLVNESEKLGMSRKEAIQFAHENMEQYLVNYMGTTGLGRDLVASSIADPQNLIPFITAKATESIGKHTGNVALQKAGRAAVGNPLIDMLPPGIQNIAEAITGKHGSQGWDTISRVYGENLRSSVNVSSLSAYQRMLAGIDSNGRIKEFTPNAKPKTPIDWIRNFFSQTNDSKMLNLSQMTTDFLGSILFDKDIRPDMIPALVEQAVGRMPIGDDSPLKQFQNTGTLNTIQDGFRGITDAQINGITETVQNYRKYNTQRAVVDSVSQTLHMTPDELFNALDDDQQRLALYQKIRDNNVTYKSGNGAVLDPENVIKNIEVFRTPKDGVNSVGRRMYSTTYMKADIMETLSSAADTYNLQRYGISADSWSIRMTELAKSMQSIALLNFSTSYQVNNFLNNLVTRSVNGVGGIDTDFIQTVAKNRGLEFSRGSDTYSNTAQAIKKAKRGNDVLQKFDDLYSDLSQRALLKGVNNIPIEDWETRAAFDIGTNRYWDATWSVEIPEMPEAWRALGITDEQMKAIRQVALDSPNLSEFRQKLMGEYVIPAGRATFKEMLQNFYEGKTGDVISDRFSTMPWVFDVVDSFMETGDPALIRKGFEDLRDMLTSDMDLKNVIQQGSTMDDLKARYANEGFGAVATAMEAVTDLYADIWIRQTKQNGTLFLDRVAQTIDEDTFRRRYEQLVAYQNADYKVARGYAIMNIAAMIEGLGLDSDVGKALLSNAMAQFDISAQFMRKEHEWYQKYAKKSSPDYDFATWRKYKIDALTNTLQAELDASKQMGDIFVKYLRDNLDSTFTGLIDDFEASINHVNELKSKLNAKEIKDAIERIDAPNKAQRALLSIQQERLRVASKTEIHNAYTQSAQMLKRLEGCMQNRPANVTPFSLSETLRAELMYAEAVTLTKRQGDFLRHYGEPANSTVKPFEPVSYANDLVQTSFREYAQNRIRSEAKNPDTVIAQYQHGYDTGVAVPLGTADANTAPQGLITDTYKPINPEAVVTVQGAKFTQLQCQPFMYGDSYARAGVYQGGELLGYITDNMPQTVQVGQDTFPVICMSKNDPNGAWVYVKNEAREVIPGKPKGVNFSVFADQNFHPGEIGTTPTIQPWGIVGLETSMPIREALFLWEDQALKSLNEARTNGSIFGKLTDEQREAVYRWMDGDLRQAFNTQRYQTQRYGETMVDMALLNYSKRYGFDSMLTAIMPYQFWMTRSIANWGARMISQPKWFSTYARIQKLIERNKKDFYPTRLNGMVGIPMPNMGDGMGDGFYFDPFNVMLPFQQFYQAQDYFIKNLNTIHRNTITAIDNMYQNHIPYNGQPITEEMYLEAHQGKGDLYKAIFEEKRAEDESDTSLGGLLGTYLNPSVAVDILYKHLNGKDKDISYSPMYRTGNLIKAVGDETPAESITNALGGAFQIPENLMRKALGIESNPDGNYADYSVVSNIANMLTMNEISLNDARNAIAEGAGNAIYDQALYRYRQSQAYRMQGGAFATEVSQSLAGNKSTSFGQLAGSALVSLFGGKIYGSGEEQFREQQAEYRKVVASGSEEAYKEFWKKYPNYSVNFYSYEDDPDVRLHKILVDNMSTAYYALPETQRSACVQAFGKQFEYYFLNPDTRATDYIPDEQLIEWTRAMQGNVPNFTDAQLNAPMREAQQVRWYADSVQADYDRYKRDFAKQFPGYDTVEEGYYNTPASMRSQYLTANPMLQKAWDYRDAALRANPKLATYLNDRSAQYKYSQGQYSDITDAIMSKLNSWTLTQLQNYMQYGWAMKPSAEQTLKTTYTSLKTTVPYETWLKSLVK